MMFPWDHLMFNIASEMDSYFGIPTSHLTVLITKDKEQFATWIYHSRMGWRDFIKANWSNLGTKYS